MRALVSAVLVTVLAAAPVVTTTPAVAAPAAPAAAEGSTYTPVSPVRVLAPRAGTSGPVGAGRTISLNLAGQVPDTATAVVLNVTAVAPTSATFVTVFPHGQARPLASNLNVVANDIRPNLVTVALGTGRAVDLYNNAGSVHLVADLAGYYAPGAGARYTALRPYRKLDTRQEGGPLGPRGTREFDLTGSVPPSATAVTFNLTATGATASTHVTAWPAGTTRPNASNLNLSAGQTRPNQVTVALGANRRVSLYNNAGQTNLVVDLAGFYTPEFGATFLPVTPSRVLDTRTGAGGPIDAGESITVDTGPNVPLNATAVLMNVTGVDATASTFVSVWTPDGRSEGAASTLNLAVGETAANLAAVALGTTGPVIAYNFLGSVHLVADLAGVFVVPSATCTVDCAYTWGGNQRWELGTGQRVPSSPNAAPVVSGVAEVAGAYMTRYALRADGTVLAWGENFWGQMGGGWFGDWSPVPARVPNLSGVTEVAAGHYHAFALLGDGTVRAWGAMFDGGHGISNVPVPVPGLTGVTAIASAAHTGYALRNDGTVWAWGSNEYGALGDGSTVEKVETPVQVSNLTNITAIATGWSSMYALRSDGTVWAWGRGDDGQLGEGFECEGEFCHPSVPLQVAGLSGATAIAAGATTAYALHTDGTVWAWGSNSQGQLGNGVTCDACHSTTPVRVTGLTAVTALASATATGYALRSDGTVWSWGSNNQSQLGDGSTCTSCRATVPVQVTGLTGVTAIAPGAAVVPTS